jgi:hypothetical protein
MDIVDPKQPFTYASGHVPPTYMCGGCKRHGVKLWMNYPIPTSLLCAECSASEQGGVDISNMRPTGIYTQDGVETDIIGSRVPAIPKEPNDCFWNILGPQLRPVAAVNWWWELPLN